MVRADGPVAEFAPYLTFNAPEMRADEVTTFRTDIV